MAATKDAPILAGREYVPDDEHIIVEQMIQQMKDQLIRLYKDSPTLRQVHNKMHGLVKAEFTIEKNLPDNLRIGIFKEPKSYCAWVRFSAGNTKLQHDNKLDTRGIGIKLLDVPGDKLLDATKNGNTHDLIFATSPVFFAKDLKSFHGLMTASISPNHLAIPLYFLSNIRMAITALTKVLFKCKHLLEIPYYSISPYRFGDEHTAVKYIMRPSAGTTVEHTGTKDFDHLKTSLKATLAKHDVSYDFFIQFQDQPEQMPIENCSIAWTSKEIKVATLRMLKQDFDTPERRELGENLMFNPWNSLPEHRPLGGLNRGRKIMYETMSKFRLERNIKPAAEPASYPTFLTEPNSTLNTTKTTSNMTTPSANLQVVQDLFKFYGQGNIQGFMSLLDPNIEWIEPGDQADIPYSGVFKGMAGIGQMMGIIQKSVKMKSFAATSFCVNDDTNTVTAMGNNEAEVIATGKSYQTDWVYAFSLVNGKVTRIQVYMDTLTMAKAFK